MHGGTVCVLKTMDPYLSPSFRYPAASLYHSDNGITQRSSHGRLAIYPAREGVDMVRCDGWSHDLSVASLYVEVRSI